MGGKLSLMIRSLSREQQTKAAVSSSQGIVELTKPKCLKKNNNNRRGQVTEPEPVAVSEWTLRDWLLASPVGPSSLMMRPEECYNGGELYVFKQSSKRVHPSSASARVLSEASSMEVSSMRRSQSGKLKKRVRFKLPEEADIIYFYSPRDTRE